MNEWIVAAFTAPEQIGTTPGSLLWMFPLLAAIAIVYKATKMRALLWRRFLVESAVLFATVSGFMILAIVVLNLLSWLITG
ncbi:MAG TPA: hypothetical protein P5175_12470 [Anaerohalosphaeraceae bacterium]|nr:hypothetical protein [Phycisphaerae bacterium]HOM76592.1 hypothetical protein [Anaerohalosphaeraceae bacterium]HPC65459.1 hypothetical protein [Anaerohalosphaeraceae bacterium]HRS72648.1 hypothetical protein [Anaerohalosphaeraceae bacterium]